MTDGSGGCDHPVTTLYPNHLRRMSSQTAPPGHTARGFLIRPATPSPSPPPLGHANMRISVNAPPGRPPRRVVGANVSGRHITRTVMPRYYTRPVKSQAWDDGPWSDGECGGHEVIDTGDWSKDQPTGLLDAGGDMIWRSANHIGFLADN